MPLWARESSPGFGVEPPPDKPADEIVWCGLLKGLFKISGWSFGKSPAIECIFVTSKASSNERSGSMLGIRCAEHCFTCSGTAYKKYVVIAGGGNFKRTLDVLLTFYVAKIKYI